MNTAPITAEHGPRLCVGGVMHARHHPRPHRFTYPLAYVRLPLGQLANCANMLFGVERWRLFSFFARDHGQRDGSALLPWIRHVLALHDLADVADGEVVLQTFPRLLGFVFNPVSFWFCHDRAGALRVVLCEVNNTFGERHNYLLAHPDRRPICGGDTLRAPKRFYVSPFFPVQGEYVFRFVSLGTHASVSVDLWAAGEKQLSTRIFGTSTELDVRGLARVAWRFPLQSFRVITRIHTQALRLWLKRVPFIRKPPVSLEETTS